VTVELPLLVFSSAAKIKMIKINKNKKTKNYND
jgi:hypothetical protein